MDTREHSKEKAIHVDVTLPTFGVRRTGRKFIETSKRFPHKRRLTIIALCALLAIMIWNRHTNSDELSATDEPQLASRTGPLTKGTPDYKTILPSGKTISDYGGWTRVSPPDRNPVFAYIDTIGEIPVNISQQPLPKDFADQPDEQLKVLALGYKADKILEAGKTKIYVGTSAKGPQSIIFTKDKLLILIKAQAAVQDQRLIDYVNSLE